MMMKAMSVHNSLRGSVVMTTLVLSLLFLMLPMLVSSQQNLTLSDPSSSSSSSMTGKDLSSRWFSAFGQYSVFPPVNDDPDIWITDDGDGNRGGIRPVEVALGVVFASIDTILPGSSEFTITSQLLIYWRKADCNQTVAHELACSADQFSTRYFRPLGSHVLSYRPTNLRSRCSFESL